MKIYKTFRKLTQFTYIYGNEHLLKEFLPSNVETDEVGNYYLKIGESETMFCSHLDTAAHSMSPVNHVQFITKNKNDIITTDGTTLLGADDKAGVVIMLNMIEKKVPGLYYFFIGEESGLIGSRGILRSRPEIFTSYKRCVAFDRRDYGSIISHQMGGRCCSDEFVDALAADFANYNMVFRNDPGGIYTDSAVFMPIIPEVTNLSVGYFNEHSHNEIQNLTYLSRLAIVATKINWEALPVVRKIRPNDTITPKRGEKKLGDLEDTELSNIFYNVDDVLCHFLPVSCYNYNRFVPGKEMIFMDFYNENKYISIWIFDNGSISIDYSEYNNDGLEEYVDYEDFLYSFKSKIEKKFNYDYEEEEEEYDDENIIDTNNEQDTHFNLVYNFEVDVNMNKLKTQINTILRDTNKNYIDVDVMDELLQKYDRDVETLIYWIFEKGENKDSSKTHGILWDGENYRFIIE